MRVVRQQQVRHVHIRLEDKISEETFHRTADFRLGGLDIALPVTALDVLLAVCNLIPGRSERRLKRRVTQLVAVHSLVEIAVHRIEDQRFELLDGHLCHQRQIVRVREGVAGACVGDCARVARELVLSQEGRRGVALQPGDHLELRWLRRQRLADQNRRARGGDV